MKKHYRISLKALKKYVEEAHGVIEVVDGNVEARFPINIETRGESVYFTIKGVLVSNDIVEITHYTIERGDQVYERPGDELEGWLIVVRERYENKERESRGSWGEELPPKGTLE